MKKKLEAELVSIAHRILQHKDHTTVAQLQEEARLVYEKLTVLRFSETHFSEAQPTIGKVISALNIEVDKPIEIVTPKVETPVTEVPLTIVDHLEEEIDEKEEDDVTAKIDEVTPTFDDALLDDIKPPEIVIEEINARVTEDLFIPASYDKNDMEYVSPTYEDLKKRSINDQLKKEIHIGLNDRLAFIKHLFKNNTSDYNNVISEISKMSTEEEAEEYILKIIKPDYNNWVGKEDYQERFLDIILSKFDS